VALEELSEAPPFTGGAVAEGAEISPGDMPAEVVPAPEGQPIGPSEQIIEGPMMGPDFEGNCGVGPDSCEGDLGFACGPDGYGGYCGHDCYAGLHRALHALILRMSFFAGIHGFKGPADLGRNGNFGFHEGLNFGAPLGDPWDIGYQIGFLAAQSNFSGNQAVIDQQPDNGTRSQFFLTAGLFRRAQRNWLQWGVVVDWLHDSYYTTADLLQIRNETSIWLGGIREIGYMGAYRVGTDAVAENLADRINTSVFGPTDVFAVFYRRHFSGGGQGRIWAGASGNGDGLLGGDILVPLGTSWSLENNFTYLSPKEGQGADGQSQESWSVNIRLVWYPGRQSRWVLRDPFHPLFSVADNSALLVDRKLLHP